MLVESRWDYTSSRRGWLDGRKGADGLQGRLVNGRLQAVAILFRVLGRRLEDTQGSRVLKGVL